MINGTRPLDPDEYTVETFTPQSNGQASGNTTGGNSGSASAGNTGAGNTGGAQQAFGYTPEPWPKLAEDALHGLAGEVVVVLEPHTEADRAALLLQFLTGFGNAV